MYLFLGTENWNLCQVSVDAENLKSTFENLSGALDWTFCQIWIWSGKLSLFSTLYIFLGAEKWNLCQSSADENF